MRAVMTLLPNMPSSSLTSRKVVATIQIIRQTLRDVLLAATAGGVFFCASTSLLVAWGPRAHRIVNEKACELLPPEMRSFYLANRSYWVEKADAADKAALTNRAEAVHHFIYFDRYGKYPFPLLSHNYNIARQRYSVVKLNKNGILPWHIGEYHLRLTEAFRSKNWDAVRDVSAWLGHYVADMAYPFGLTENFNGQLSAQHGISDRIGTALFDRYANFMLLRPGRADYLKDPTENAFQLGLENYIWVDNYLLADRRAFEAAGGAYNDSYYERLYNVIGPMISQQISEAIENLASYWYTAWVNAGKPALPPQ